MPSKGSEKHIGNSGGEKGLSILEFRGQGVRHFGISEGKGLGGIKMFMPPVVGYGYFLELPIYILMIMIKVNKFFFFHF